VLSRTATRARPEPVLATAGRTFDELVRLTNRPPDVLGDVLRDELRRRRVRLDADGRYRLVVDRFEPALLAVLARLFV
jgi:hypothetical protein